VNYKTDYFGFIYLWYDRKRNKFCLGSHMGSLEDDYITSTGYMKKAYRKRPDDFKRKILYFHQTSDRVSLLEVEQCWLNMIQQDELKDKYYNMTKNAAGMSSEDAKRFNDKRIESGSHNFLGPDMNRKRVNDGTHHLLGGKIAKRNAEKRLKDGTHHFLEEGFSKQVQLKRINEGTHNFLGGQMQKETSRKLLLEGKHSCQVKGKCPHCGIVTNLINIRKWHNNNCKSLSSINN